MTTIIFSVANEAADKAPENLQGATVGLYHRVSDAIPYRGLVEVNEQYTLGLINADEAHTLLTPVVVNALQERFGGTMGDGSRRHLLWAGALHLSHDDIKAIVTTLLDKLSRQVALAAGALSK